MKRITTIALLLLQSTVYAQTADTAELSNFLQAPNSPGATLIGTAPSDIAKPTDPAAFMVSVLNSTKGLTSFPSSYAVDVAPGWLLAGKKIKYEDLQKSTFKDNIWQNLVISAAYNTTGDSVNKNTNLGLGFKISFARGKFSDKLNKMVDSTTILLAAITGKRDAALQQSIENNPAVTRYDAIIISYRRRNMPDSARYYTALQTATIKQLFDSTVSAMKQDYSAIKAIVKRMDFTRHGFLLDLTAGTSMLFPKQVFNKGSIDKAGAWLSGGYSTQSGFSFLGMVRYLYNPDKIYADEKGVLKKNDLSTLDGGARIVYNNSSSHFSFSGEGVYRSVLNKTDVNPTWRFTVNAEYEVMPNKILTLAFGRDFDGTFSKDGNIIAAINLVMGFGNMVKAVK